MVQQLLAHVDKHARSDPRNKTSIVTVLYEAVLIAAGNSTGVCLVSPRYVEVSMGDPNTLVTAPRHLQKKMLHHMQLIFSL